MKIIKAKNETLVFIILIILFTNLFIAAESESEKTEKEIEALSQELGKNLDKFFERGIEEKKYIIEDPTYRSLFIDSLIKNNNLDKLAERWFEVDDKSISKLDKNTRIILLKELLKKDKSFAKKLLVAGIKRAKVKNPSFYFDSVDDFVIDDNLLENIVWDGNKLGFINQDKKLELWIDFDDLPAFLTKAEFKSENGIPMLSLTFNGEPNSVTWKINKGSINFKKEYVASDGNVFGLNPLGLKSIHYDDDSKTLEVGYYDSDGNLQKIKFNPEELLKGSVTNNNLNTDKLMELLSNEYFLEIYNNKFGKNLKSEDIKKVFQGIKILQEAQKNPNIKLTNTEINKILSDAGVTLPLGFKMPDLDSQEGKSLVLKTAFEGLMAEIGNKFRNIDIPDANKLNLGFVRRGAEGIAEGIVIERGDGKVEITLKGRALAVSTNVEGGAGIVMGVNPKNSEEETQAIYNKLGVLEAHKYGEQIVFDDQGKELLSVYSEKEFIGTKVVRSTIANLGLLENRVPKEVRDLIGTALAKKVGLVLNEEASVQDVAYAIKELQALVDNKNLDYETSLKLKEFLGIAREEFTKTLKESVQNIANNKDIPSELRMSVEKIMNSNLGTLMTERTNEQIEQVTRSLTQPENIELLMNYYNDPEKYSGQLNEFIQKQLENSVGDYDGLFARNALPGLISEKIDELTQGSVSLNVPKLKNDLDEWIKSQDFLKQVSAKKSGDFKQAARTELQNKLKASGQLSDDQINSILTEYDKTTTGISDYLTTQINAQQKDFVKKMLDRTAKIGVSNYGTNILYDEESGDLIYSGNEKAIVDVKQPLVKVSVNHKGDGTGENSFILNSYGVPIARFNGENTFANRYIGSGNMAPILDIENVRKPNEKLMVLTDGYQYHIVDPFDDKDLETVFKHYGTYSITGIPLIGSINVLTHVAEMQRNKNIQDAGLDPDAVVSLNPIAQGINTGFLSRIINRVVNKAVSKQFGQFQGQLPALANEISKDVDTVSSKVLDQKVQGELTRRDILRTAVETGNSYLNIAEGLGLSDLPSELEVRDTLEALSIISEKDNIGIKREMNNFLTWLVDYRRAIQPGASLEIATNKDGEKVLRIGNEEYDGFNQALLRQMLREINYNEDKIPSSIRQSEHWRQALQKMRNKRNK